MLYIVSTPIGNLTDITLRAIETLKMVDLIAAEDTRHTKILCQHYEIKTPLTSYFEHNKIKKSEVLLEELKAGKNIALVTDAGTPGICDPGYRLINLVKENNIPITVVPGPTAVIAALSLSGLPTDRFVFEGFLPIKKVGRQKKLKELGAEDRTIIVYESPHRLLKSLNDIKDTLNDPVISCIREITKKFEEEIKGKTSDVIKHFQSKKPKGEFVILFNLSHQRTKLDKSYHE